ncbi:MAG: recombinase family protein [Deltaproteobacteria bacterium]
MKKIVDIKKVRSGQKHGGENGKGFRSSTPQIYPAAEERGKAGASVDATGVSGLEPGMRLALYARVSTQMQEKEETVTSQINELVNYAQLQGLFIPDEWRFVDEGYSGSTLARPALDAVRDKVAEGVVDMVLVHDPDRLARDYVHQMLLVEEIERNGCRFHFVRRPIGVTPDEKLLLQMQGVIAEYERAKICERTRRGKLHRMRCGEIVTGRRTFGYKYIPRSGDNPSKFEVVPEEADAVRKLFSWFVDDRMSIRGVTARLNSESLAKPLRCGRWTKASIHNILRNSMYYGIGHANRVEAILPGKDRPLQPVYRKYPKTGKRERPREEWLPFGCPPIISEETYQLAQERLSSNKELSSRNTKRDYLLRGLLFCRECGRRFQASTHTGRYICAYTRRQVADDAGVARCGNETRLPINGLDGEVWREVAALIKRPSTLRKYHRILQGKLLPKACSDSDLGARKEKLDQRIRRINDLYVRGEIGRDDHAGRLKLVKEELHKVTSKIAKLKEQLLEDHEVEQMLKSFSNFSSAIKKEIDDVDFATRRQIVENMVKRVIIGKKDVTIEYAIALKNSKLCPTNRNR